MNRHLEYPQSSLFDFLASRAREVQGLTALEYYGAKISYRRLIGEISRCARALTAIGVSEGDSVSICLPNIPQAVFLFYAVNKIGAVANMIHPMSGENEIVRYMKLTESRFLFGLDMMGDKLRRVMAEVKPDFAAAVDVGTYMPPVIRAGAAFKSRGTRKDISGLTRYTDFLKGADKVPHNVNTHGTAGDTAAILYSGGTTGKPKGIMLTNLNFNALALQSIDGSGSLYQGERMLSVMPIFHGFGLGVCIHTILILGGTAIILPKFSAKEFGSLLFRYRPNIISGVPAIYESMLTEEGFDGRSLDFIKTIISGGDSLAPSSKKKLNEMLAAHGCSARVREGYGLTECVTGSCLLPEDCDDLESVGKPYADTYYKIVDPATDMELPAGETGEIILRGPTVMKGYYKEPEETANTLRVREDGHTWLYTGDLGYISAQGLVYFRQRLKRMIVSGGYNIYPQQLEEVICSHKNVVMCAVVGLPDRIMGERTTAFVVADEGADEEKLREELMEMLRKEVAVYALPREIRFRKELPHTLVGKIAYNELKAEE